jgi:hypothetical protein
VYWRTPGARLLLAAFAWALVVCPPAVQAASGGRLVVTFEEEWFGEPIPGARVLLSTDENLGRGRYGLREGFTDSSGRVVFVDLPPDDYWFEFSMPGADSRKWIVDVFAGLTRRVKASPRLESQECHLGEFNDFRGTLDGGVPAGTVVLKPSHWLKRR